MSENKVAFAIAKGLISSIPIAGPVAIELVNRKLQEEQQERLNILHKAIFETIDRLENIHQPSEELQSRIIENTLKSDEEWRAQAYANLLFEDNENTPDIRRKILADMISELKLYDVWILLNIQGNEQKLKEVPNAISDAIYKLETEDKNISELRPYSLNKLSNIGLVAKTGKSGSYSMQPLGKEISEFI